jgi:hypothetical protein
MASAASFGRGHVVVASVVPADRVHGERTSYVSSSRIGAMDISWLYGHLSSGPGGNRSRIPLPLQHHPANGTIRNRNGSKVRLSERPLAPPRWWFP